MSIHSTAIIEDGAQLGADVHVAPFAYIAAGAEVGDGCRIGPHAVIYGSAALGPACQVHAGAVVGDTPQDLSFKETESFVRIGAGCVLREGVTIHRGTKEGSATTVGDGCYLMGFSHLAHNVRLGERVIIANGALLAGYVDVADGVFVSGNVVVHQFCRIGRLAMLGGGSAVSQDVPPFCMTFSGALNRIAGLNVVGLRRAGLSPDERSSVKQAYRLLYSSGLNLKQAMPELQSRFPDGPAAEFAAFLAASERGICTPTASSDE